MFLSSLLFAAGLLVAETPDTLQAVTIVADKGVVVSRTDTVALHADGTAAEALLRIPGLGISDYGGLAGLKSVSLRGLGTPHTDIYLDGVRVSNFQSGQNDLGMLPLEVLGNAVIDYAQNSVSFRTAKPVFGDRSFAGRVGLQAGSFSTWQPSARFDVKLSERVALSVHGAGIVTKGDFPIADEFIPRTEGATKAGVRRTGNDLKQIRTGLDLFGTLDGGEWQAKAYYNASDRGTPGSLTWPSEDRQQDKNVVVQGSLRKAFSDLYTLNLSAKGAYDKIYYQSTWGDSDYNFTDFQLNSSHTFRLTDWWGISLAADLERGALKSPGLYDAARTAVISALASAIRLERFQADLALEYRGTFDKGAKGLNSLSPSLDLRVTLFEGFDLVAFGRRAFRAPTFNELYYPGYGNPDLKPEDAWLTDIGIDWNTTLSDTWSLGLKADCFYNYLQNKIISAPMPDDYNVWLPYNIGIVQAKGADTSLNLRYDDGRLAGGFSARYARQSAVDKTPDSYSFDQQVPYVAKNTVVLAGDVEFAGWRFDALWNWRGGRFDASGEMPDWNTLDLSLRKDFTLGNVGVLGLNVTVRDLLDYRYELVRNYPMPGRSVLGGFTFKF
ncbi:MAG: TonB-dependent receptor [Bacteroidales bacterium]|nr:TonB-dependent receptor [Bacteroidales bacterium]